MQDTLAKFFTFPLSWDYCHRLSLKILNTHLSQYVQIDLKWCKWLLCRMFHFHLGYCWSIDTGYCTQDSLRVLTGYWFHGLSLGIWSFWTCTAWSHWPYECMHKDTPKEELSVTVCVQIHFFHLRIQIPVVQPALLPHLLSSRKTFLKKSKLNVLSQSQGWRNNFPAFQVLVSWVCVSTVTERQLISMNNSYI